MPKAELTKKEKILEAKKQRIREVIKDIGEHRFYELVHEEYDRVLEDYILHPSAECRPLILKLIKLEKNFLYA
jgi:hypothetical protein